MRYAVRFAFAVLLFSALTVSLEQTAHAYVDPGSGLLLMQAIGSMFTCAVIYFRRNILGFFHKPSAETEGEFVAAEDQRSAPTNE